MLIIGGTSLIGAEIIKQLTRDGDYVEQTNRCLNKTGYFLNLEDFSSIDFSFVQSKTAIFCAAASNLSWCETNPERSSQINIEGTIKTLDELTRRGLSGVFLSTSQVFNGEKPQYIEHDAMSFKNQYGFQKASVEAYITRNNLPFSILRLSKVLSKSRRGIFDLWVRNLEKNNKIDAASDLFLSPIEAQEVAAVAINLSRQHQTGIWHMSAANQLSYVDACKHMAKFLGLNPKLINRQSAIQEKIDPKFIQKFTTLNCNKLENFSGFRPPSTESVIESIFTK